LIFFLCICLPLFLKPEKLVHRTCFLYVEVREEQGKLLIHRNEYPDHSERNNPIIRGFIIVL